MKSILLSIRPELVAKILNGEKTIEIRKQFPKDYVGWVYIYCTKRKGILTFEYASVDNTNNVDYPCGYNVVKKLRNDNYIFHNGSLNGKVVARFWCGKIEMVDFVDRWDWEYETDTLLQDELLEESCLTLEELDNYLKEDFAWGIYISKLEVFDRPKELSEFYCNYTLNDYKKGVKTNYIIEPNILMKKLTKAPQNYCYVEGE